MGEEDYYLTWKNVYDQNDGRWDPNFSRYISVMNNPLHCFNIDRLRKLEDYQIGWGDKTHTKVCIGSFNHNQITSTIQLFRGAYGNIIGILYKSNGTVNEEPFITTF